MTNLNIPGYNPTLGILQVKSILKNPVFVKYCEYVEHLMIQEYQAFRNIRGSIH